MPTATLSDKSIRALSIVRDEPGICSTRFARRMWPDSDGWNKHSNIGHGATTGVGMWRAGGSFLRRLERRGLVFVRCNDYSKPFFYLTSEGEAALAVTERDE